jgi:uncharacterized protein DUF4056
MVMHQEALFEAPLAHEAGRPPVHPVNLRRKRVIRETIGGFPRYQQRVQSLSVQERTKIDRIAGLIVRSHRPGSRPIREVSLIGHADRDQQRGRAFEVKISRDRAREIQRALVSAAIRQSRSRVLVARLRWRIEGAGATQMIARSPRSESDRARNRRVDVFMTPAPVYLRRGRAIRPRVSEFEAPSPLSARVCCILAPTTSPFSPTDNLVEPGKLGTHRGGLFGGDTTGLIYTGGAGFVDLGHLRDLIDMTKFIYDQIVAAGGKPTSIRTTHGIAKITTAVPAGSWFQLAMDIGFDDSFGYEILTYSLTLPGQHNSSFSPEDLPSNYMGTAAAIEAIKAGGSFDAAATARIDALIKSLDGQSVAESLKAFNRINGRWVDFKDASSPLLLRYLKRRNFTFEPWKTGHSSDKPKPGWYGSGMGSTAGFYTYTHTAGRTIPKADFVTETRAIRADAKKVYGPDYDKPV